MATRFERQLEAMRHERERQDERLTELHESLHRVSGHTARLPLHVVNTLEERARRAERELTVPVPTGALRA
jgi:hypothetical protein